MLTLRQSGYQKAIAGITSLDDVLSNYPGRRRLTIPCFPDCEPAELSLGQRRRGLRDPQQIPPVRESFRG